MRIGTTPTYIFKLPFDTSLVQKVKITFRQNRTVVLEKKDDCVLEGDTISVTLTQKETFLFDTRYKADVQLRVTTTEDKALSTDIYSLEITECLDREVL